MRGSSLPWQPHVVFSFSCISPGETFPVRSSPSPLICLAIPVPSPQFPRPRFLARGSVAQLVEQGIENPCVGGSIPSRATFTVNELERFLLLESFRGATLVPSYWGLDQRLGKGLFCCF